MPRFDPADPPDPTAVRARHLDRAYALFEQWWQTHRADLLARLQARQLTGDQVTRLAFVAGFDAGWTGGKDYRKSNPCRVCEVSANDSPKGARSDAVTEMFGELAATQSMTRLATAAVAAGLCSKCWKEVLILVDAHAAAIGRR